MAQTRREFLTRLVQDAGLACTGGLVWGYLLSQQAKASPTALRPPGALAETEFNAACIKCGQCAAACPYDTLKMGEIGGPAAIGTPYFTAREVPCYLCEDIPCKAACPTGALDPSLTEINDSRMGLAIIDIENCLSWQGLRCEICYRDCPITKEGEGKAITIMNNPRKLSKHALFVPLVHSEYCTGCGICEKACPTDKAAIRVLPAQLVQGQIGKHYRLGWKNKAGITEKFVPAPQGAAPQSDVGGALDSLNSGEL